jgi:hypothetical protein
MKITDNLVWDGKPLTDDMFDPPPWKINSENAQKTEGWIERQRWERKQKED